MKRSILISAILLVGYLLVGTFAGCSSRLPADEVQAADAPEAPEPAEALPPQGSTSPVAHLTFQIFTDAYPKLWDAPNRFSATPVEKMQFRTASRSEIAVTVTEIVRRIGTTGSASRKLGFTVGPIALEYTDDQIRNLIRDAFEVAEQERIAVGFHIDDSMFWYRRRDLWQKAENIEWLDWSGTPNTGRRLDWSPAGARLAPQMCYNARDIVAEVTRVAKDVIGSAIQDGVAKLARAGRAELFAGVIVGWETQLGKDFATSRPLGFCALSNRGFSRDRPPADIDAERELIVQSFIELWSSSIASAGVDRSRIYSHTAFVSRLEYDKIVASDASRRVSFSAMNNFAPPRVSFGRNHNPGFSTYPAPGLYAELYDQLRRYPSRTGWASAEGTNVRIGMNSGEESMEIYLARHFNHGATLVNLFGWGAGDESNPFKRATESPEAITAYRKFLSGAPLVEVAIPSDYGLPQKVNKVQQQLPVWLKAGGDPKKVEPLLEEMWRLIRANRPSEAEAVVDRLLTVVNGPPLAR